MSRTIENTEYLSKLPKDEVIDLKNQHRKKMIYVYLGQALFLSYFAYTFILNGNQLNTQNEPSAEGLIVKLAIMLILVVIIIVSCIPSILVIKKLKNLCMINNVDSKKGLKEFKKIKV
jgi:hypothetical protein